MRARSLSVRLVRGVLLGLAVLLVATGAVLYFGARSRLAASLDRDLELRAASLCSVLHVEGVELEFEFDAKLMPEYGDHAPLFYFEIRDAKGDTIHRSRSLGGGELELSAPAREPAFMELRTPDGRSGRAFSIPYVPVYELEDEYDYEDLPPPVPLPLTVIVAAGRETIEGPLKSLVVAMSIALAFFAAGSIAIVYRSVRTGLAPLARLTRELAEIGPTTLDRRVAEEGLPSELEPLARHTNAMLDRIHEGVERERVFTTSVAHELRTPIAELRTESEVALRGATANEDLLRCVRSNLDIAKEMEDVVESLLFLRRAELGRADAPVEDVDVAALVRDALEASAELRAKRGVSLASDLPRELRARTNPALLSLVLRNLLSNASEYATEGSALRLEASAREGGVELSIANRTDALAEQDLKHLGTPFWRKDRARGERVHAGLGVSVVNGACRVLGIGVTYELVGDELRAKLSIPA